MQYDVVTIGSATRDVFLKSSALKVLKDPEHLKQLGFEKGEAECFALGAKIEIDRPVLTSGGGATNSAVTFARQGFKTACITALGNDITANDIKLELEQEGVTPIISTSTQNGTGYSTLLLTGGGERTILVYRGATSDLNDQELPLSEINARWVYIVPGAIEFSVIMNLINHFKSQGSKIVMNPSSHYLSLGLEKLKPMLSALDVITLNREEAALLTGEEIENEEAIFKKFDELVGGIAVMTDGPKGCVVSNGETVLRAGIFPEKTLADRTGAGDAFGSGFTAGLIHADNTSEEALREGIRLGSANSTSVVEHIGAKEGILKKEGFIEPRFQNLEILKN